ncbi:MAG: YCF48-related protein, partial [Bacteroidota bacterium]
MKKNLLLLIFISFCISRATAQWTAGNVGSWELNDMQMVSPTQGFMVSITSVWTTTNAGANWSTLHYIQSDSLYYQNISKHALYFFNSSTGVVVGKDWNNKSIIIRTTNGGTLWTTVYLGTTGVRFKDVWFTDASNGIAVSTGGKIVRTTDGGLTWNAVSSGTIDDLYAVHFDPSNPNTGVACGDEVMLRTTNGGASWTPAAFSGVYFTSVNFAGANVGYACGDYTDALYKTVDGGANWQVVPTNVSHFNAVYFLSPDTGYACDGSLYRTTDGGVSWEENIVPGAGDL